MVCVMIQNLIPIPSIIVLTESTKIGGFERVLGRICGLMIRSCTCEWDGFGSGSQPCSAGMFVFLCTSKEKQ